MVKYELQEQDDCFVIMDTIENVSWLVEAAFEKSEKDYAEAFTNILNAETNKVCDNGTFKLKKAYYEHTGKFFDFD
jgi:hypothetical protein